jgi:hypothetical protein
MNDDDDDDDDDGGTPCKYDIALLTSLGPSAPKTYQLPKIT